METETKMEWGSSGVQVGGGGVRVHGLIIRDADGADDKTTRRRDDDALRCVERPQPP
jgi:hypothetical protein